MKLAFVGRQEYRGLGDLVGVADAPHRYLRSELVEHPLLAGLVRARQFDQAGGLPAQLMVWDSVRDGSLCVVLADHATALTPIHAVYAAQRLLSQRAVVFMDHMAAVCRHARLERPVGDGAKLSGCTRLRRGSLVALGRQ